MGDTKTNFNITINLKDLIIIGLIIFCIFLYFNPFKNSTIKELEESIKDKDNQIKKIELQRDSLKKVREKLDVKIDSIEKIYQFRKDTINNLKRLSQSQRIQINQLRGDVDMYNNMISENEKRIKDIKQNPILVRKDKLLKKITEKL